MVDVFERHQCSVLGVQNVPREQTRQYGIVSSTALETNLESVSGIVEKPRPEDAPSTLAVVGRYVLTPRIFHHLENVQAGAGGEIQLTDGIAALMREEKMLAYRFNGTRYDCGAKLGYLKAMVALGLKHPEVRDEFAAYLQSLK
jgi:UTP--glucose-1-phosphate uridylyltransferase